MSGFQRVESKFAPIPDAVYTMYPVEATFVISSQKQTPGVNFKMKINDMDEQGAPQAKAGSTFFLTKHLTEKTVGDFCQLLDSMGFKTDAEGFYVSADGTRLPDFFKMQDKETISFLVGLPFVGKLTSSDNNYTAADGTPKESTQYNVRANWVTPADGGRKVMQLSVHPSKAEAFAMAGQSLAPTGTTGGVPAPTLAAAFANNRSF